jgi:Pentapeptide repeats (9 copies)
VAEVTKPKRKAKDNPWYRLATLHGEPVASDDEGAVKNRETWNRWMASQLPNDLRVALLEKGHRLVGEPTPFPDDELRTIGSQLGISAEAEIDFSDTEFEALCANRFVFPGTSSFAGATFCGNADFRGATFTGNADFRGVTFCGNADFRGAMFCGNANFMSATFIHHAGFRNATFTGNTNFRNATFRGDVAGFGSATFTGNTDFSSATFCGNANFMSATFSRYAGFLSTTFTGNTNFSSAAFTGNTDFSSATFCGNANFMSSAFSRYAGFRSATFTGSTNFSNATFRGDVAGFGSATFAGDANFVSATFSRYAGFRKATFRGDGVFTNAEMKGRTSFDDVNFHAPPQCFNTKLHEGTTWHGAQWPKAPRGLQQARKFIDAYERLKLEMDRLKKHGDELDFFAREQQCRRVLLGAWRGLPIAIYGFLSDYGRSYGRPLSLLAVTVFIGAVICSADLVGFWTPLLADLDNTGRALGISFSNTLGPLGKPLMKPEVLVDLPNWLKAIAVIQSILGVALLFLFGLGIRNRFRMK